MARTTLDAVSGGDTTRAPAAKKDAPAVGLRKVLGSIKAGWLKFAWVLAKVNSTILLTLMYFLIIAPTNLILRLSRADPLGRRIGGERSFWHESEAKKNELEACRRQF